MTAVVQTRADKKLRRASKKRRERLVLDNIRLVHWFVFKMLKIGNRHRDYADAVQEGMIALCSAADGFRPGLGFKFATYAAQAIRNRLARWRRYHEQRGINYRFGRPDELPRVMDFGAAETEDRADPYSPVDAADDPLPTDDPDEFTGVLGAAFRALPAREQLIIRRTVCVDEPYRGVADELGLTRERVRQLLERALLHMRRSLKASERP